MAIIHIRGSGGEGNEPSGYSPLVENVGALIVATLALGVFMLLAAIDPATWTFQSNTASHLRSELWNCLTIKDDAGDLAATTISRVNQGLTRHGVRICPLGFCR